ncbi:MAG: pilus assembly protein TadG-related protein [Pseudomonadota bacterium]
MDQPTNINGRFNGGFFKALLDDAAANTIAIGAASLVPLLAMVGGAVDASRFYMAETRMQAACDAGALAARRAMADDTFTNEHKQIGENFYDQNLETGMFGMTTQGRTYVGTEGGEVQGTASGVLPTSLMGIFGYGQFDLSVSCTADINISNTDIMFVVDVTGSMNCAPDNPGGGNCGNTEDAGAKMIGLRAAVMTFYDTVEASTSPQAQVRYGMVPYASNVNVGGAIIAENASWMASDAVFESRWARFSNDGPVDEESGEWVEIGEEVLEVGEPYNEGEPFYDFETEYVFPESACADLAPASFENQLQTELGTHQGQSDQYIEGNLRYTVYPDDNETLRSGEGGYQYRESDGRCRYGWEVTEFFADVTWAIVEELQGEGSIQFEEWIYGQVDTANPPGGDNPAGSPAGWESVDLTTLYDSTPQVSVPIGGSGNMATQTWDGCIEEADTVATTNFDPIPSGALDMNINLVPSTQAERWKPVVKNLVWERRDGTGISEITGTNTNNGDIVTVDVAESERVNANGVTVNQSRPGYSCPKAAFRLTDITRSDLEAYVDSLQGRSNTYHDIGMLWGARFISPNGIFASSNAAAPNGDAIARHIVFMTDGLLAPNWEVYGMYGLERWTRRVSGSGNSGTLSTAHAERFQAACRLARQENISVWVVAFGTELTENLADCATPGRAFVADDSTELADTFQDIAQQIAALRLTQ